MNEWIFNRRTSTDNLLSEHFSEFDNFCLHININLIKTLFINKFSVFIYVFYVLTYLFSQMTVYWKMHALVFLAFFLLEILKYCHYPSCFNLILTLYEDQSNFMTAVECYLQKPLKVIKPATMRTGWRLNWSLGFSVHANPAR